MELSWFTCWDPGNKRMPSALRQAAKCALRMSSKLALACAVVANLVPNGRYRVVNTAQDSSPFLANKYLNSDVGIKD